MPFATRIGDGKMFFHVRSHGPAFTSRFMVLDDKLGLNDYIGDVSFDAKAWLDRAMADRLYAAGKDGDNPMRSSWWDYRLGGMGR